MKKLFKNKSFMLLLFLAIYSFAIGLFGNYRELWLSSNGISTLSISKIIVFASIVTALSLLIFSLKVSPKKLKNGMTVTLILKMITGTLLLLFNDTNNYFFIKFIMFFDIAFREIIFSSIYPLMLNVQKSDVLYTKKEVFQSVGDKIGLFIASFLIGQTIGWFVIDYNKLLLLSVIFLFISFIVLVSIDVEGKNSETVNLKKSIKYFNNNKIIYLYLILNFFSSMTWSSILGLKMLSLTEIMSVSAKNASYLILIMGILTNILAILIVKYLKFKNDYINIFFKYGLRLILYFLVFIIDNPTILFITFVYLLLTDLTFNFVFSGFITNNIDEEHVLVYNVFKYCVTLVSEGIGVFICGLTFKMGISNIGLVTFSLGLVTYVLSNILVFEKNKKFKKIV